MTVAFHSSTNKYMEQENTGGLKKSPDNSSSYKEQQKQCKNVSQNALFIVAIH
jgi:hypothetical protein